MAELDDVGNIREWALQQQQTPVLKDSGDKLVVVLKQHRFYKQLCIELYRAHTTGEGKLKNPLIFVNPLDLTWKTDDATELKFFSGVARFQNNATTSRSPQDLEALQAVTRNPLGLDFFYHHTNKSENIVAASLKPVAVGKNVTELSLFVTKKDSWYELRPQFTIGNKTYDLHEVEIKYDYFVLLNNNLYLLNHFSAARAIQLFPPGKASLSVHESKFPEFRKTALSKLEDRIPVHYSFIAAATEEQLKSSQHSIPPERFIYLSELGDFVIIDPVIRYGNTDIPIRTKRQVYSLDKKRNEFVVTRDDAAEIQFTGLLLQQHPFFEEQLENDLPYFYLHRKRFLQQEWFLNAFNAWQQEGIAVLGFNKLKDNKLNGHKAKITIRVTSGTNWFNTDLDVRFGNKKASLKELQQAVKNKHQYVSLDDGTLGILPSEWLERFAAYFNAGEVVGEELLTAKVRFTELEELYEAASLDEEVKRELSEYHLAFQDFDNIRPVDMPPGLNTQLRVYQQHGLNWLNFLDDLNFGGCLADDMGLGKTIQVLAFILLQRQKTKRNTNLLVVPTSLIFNWQAEVKKFAPSIKIFTIESSRKIKYLQLLDDYEIVLVSYGMLVTSVSWLRNYSFNYVFADESQQIKNIDSQRYRAMRLLQSRNRLAITGTPVENNVFDLYAQLSFLNPGLLGNKQFFRDTYSIPIDKFKNQKRAKELQQKVAPFILRRTKQQVAAELPVKTEMILYCPMEEGQRKVYDAYEKEFREFIAAETEDEIKKSSMHVLRGITKLRQICNSPVIMEDEKLYTEGAAKIDVLMEQIENKSSQHKILVFSQFVSMLSLVKKELITKNIQFEWLTGSTKNREAAVNNFQQNPDVRVFLVSLKAGGTGLNLTEADYVYLVDPWWNPAVENQAIDRSYRIGQNKPVVAVRLICPDTIEEKIMNLQEIKKNLSDDIVKSDESIYKSISKQELLDLVRG
ncbi:MAG: DEAD/DEAH box helicase [Bacteroidota bacterium]